MDNNELRDSSLRDVATARLRARHDLRQYLLVWAGVSVLVVAIWAATSATVGHPLYFWPIWPILGMGIGAAAKASAAYGSPRRLITEADIDAEVARLSR
jgi:hypothetical protein